MATAQVTSISCTNIQPRQIALPAPAAPPPGRVSDRDVSLSVTAGYQGQIEITAHIEARHQYLSATLPRLSPKAARELAALLIRTADSIGGAQ